MNLRLRLPVLSKCAMSINRFRSYSRHRRHCSTKPNRGSIDVYGLLPVSWTRR